MDPPKESGMRNAIRRCSAILTFAFLPTVLPAAVHATDIVGVDLTMSTVMQQQQTSFSGIGIRFRLKSTGLVENIEFLPNMEYWRNSANVPVFELNATRKDATIGVDARYTFFQGGWEPYVGTGWALHFLSNEVIAPGFNNARNAYTKGGLTALAGVSFPLTAAVNNFIELKYHHLSDAKQLKFNWGIAFNL
jgi:opacity protein-like surface antigen